VPSLDLRFAESKSLVDAVSGQNLITFTRASTGTFVDSDGVIRSAGNDVARFNHNPLTGECLGLLVEEQRQNLLLRSEEFDNASWTRTGFLAFGSGSTANAATAPNGTTTADLLVESTAVNTERNVYQAGVVATTGTLTVYAKASGRSHVGLRFYVATNNWVRATYTLTGSGTATAVSAGSSSDYSATAASIEQFADGWYRVRLTATRDSGLSFAVIDFATTANPTLQAVNGNEFYTGDGTSGILLWGAQLEVGAFPTSYIGPTTTTAITRTADVVSITGTNFSSWYRQDEGTMFVDGSSQNVLASAGGFVVINDPAGGNRLDIRQYRAQPIIEGGSSGSMTWTTPGSFPVISANASYRQAVAYSATADNHADAISGVVETSTTSIGNIAANRLALFMRDAQTAPTGGTGGIIRRLTYWPARLNNSILQSLTQ
jgi:hypothetical protein